MSAQTVGHAKGSSYCKGGFIMLVAAVLLAWSALPFKAGSYEVPPKDPKFEKDVLPIFEKNCLRCHATSVKMGQLDLSSLEGLQTGGQNGRVIVPGKPNASPIYDLVRKGVMPFDHKTQVSASEMETIRLWIETFDPSEGSNRSVKQLNQNDVIPIILRHCTTCHGFLRKKGGLDLRTKASMLRGGHSGPALVPGQPGSSLMLRMILSKQMPPPIAERTGTEEVYIPLNEDETGKLKQWIEQGAPELNVPPDVATRAPDPLVTDDDRNFWSFQPPAPVEVPSVRHNDRVRNPIDAFILSKLEAKGLTLAPEADRSTLVRRVYLDLTGLPPTREEAESFVNDEDPLAYEKLIDRLLGSPHYGERWARYWLDLAGYSDSEDKDVQRRPNAWRYRDYVIRAFNADKPYDRFLVEQIAGDELVDYEHAPVMTQGIMDNLVATGFLRMSPDRTVNAAGDDIQEHVHIISDEMQVFSSTVLGLTVQCMECHDHKMERGMPQRDYYRLRAVFRGAYDEFNWLPADLGKGVRPPARIVPYVTPGANTIDFGEEETTRKAHNQELDDRIREVQAQLDKKTTALQTQIVEKQLSSLPQDLRDDLRRMLSTPPEKRNDHQKSLAQKYGHLVEVDSDKLKEIDPEYKVWSEETGKKILILQSKKVPEPYIRALWDRGEPSPMYIYLRGDFENPGRLVGPGVPSILTDGKTPFIAQPPWPGATKTGLRLALAHWVISPKNPLTARVEVNRLWEHHFAKGIVATPDNFGRSGSPPTHRELLDWLALKFVQQDWSIKSMQRLILTSSTYRQSSNVTPFLEKIDPHNDWLSRMPLTRMDAETLRDSLLFVSGRLDQAPYGPPDLLYIGNDGLISVPETAKGWRRTIYVEQTRKRVLTVLDLFDYPTFMDRNSLTPNCPKRTNTSVATQALYLMNDPEVRKLATYFAERVWKEAGSNPVKQIESIYWLAMSRHPTVEEKKTILKALPNGHQSEPRRRGDGKDVLAELCLTVINSGAFIFVN